MSKDIILPENPLTTVKRAHDPERVEKQRLHLNKVYEEMKAGYVADCKEDPGGATKPNKPAIREYWGNKWAEQSRATQRASEPIDVAPENALFEWIDGYEKVAEKKANMERPMHQVMDLSDYAFKIVKAGTEYGDLWISSAVLLGVDKGGLVRVWVRQTGTTVEMWAGQCGFVKLTSPLLEEVDYTVNELFKMLSAMRISKNAMLNEVEMDGARTYLIG